MEITIGVSNHSTGSNPYPIDREEIMLSIGFKNGDYTKFRKFFDRVSSSESASRSIGFSDRLDASYCHFAWFENSGSKRVGRSVYFARPEHLIGQQWNHVLLLWKDMVVSGLPYEKAEGGIVQLRRGDEWIRWPETIALSSVSGAMIAFD